MIALIREELLAYLRLGMVAPAGRSAVCARQEKTADVGVLFVPGVGANGSQFAAMKRALETEAHWFDSFEYSSLIDPRESAARLKEAIAQSDGYERLVVVGHSLGGLLLRMVLQAKDPPSRVAGYAAICSPLHGTWRSKLVPHPVLRQLAPDSALMEDLRRTESRLERYRGRIVTIGARRDQFIAPHTSAFLDGAEQLILDDVAHAGSLFDPRVHAAVRRLVAKVRDFEAPR